MYESEILGKVVFKIYILIQSWISQHFDASKENDNMSILLWITTPALQIIVSNRYLLYHYDCSILNGTFIFHFQKTMIMGNNDDPIIPGSGYLGSGINICGKFDGKSLVSIYDMEKGTEKQPLGIKPYVLPRNAKFDVGPDDGGAGVASTYATREQYDSHFSASASASLSDCGFSVVAEASFSKDIDDASYHSFGVYTLNYKAYDLWIKDKGSDALSANIKKAYEDLPKVYSPPGTPMPNQRDFFNFFDRFGTHYLSRITMGANLYYSTTVDNNSSFSKTDTSAEITAEFNGVLFDTKETLSTDFEVADEKWFDSTKRMVYSQGGGDIALKLGTPSYNNNKNDVFLDWLDAVNNGDVALVDFVLESIDNIFAADQAWRGAVRHALSDYLNCHIKSVMSDQSSSITVNGVTVRPDIFTRDTGEYGKYQILILNHKTLDIILAKSWLIDPFQTAFAEVSRLLTDYLQSPNFNSNDIIVFNIICAMPIYSINNIDREIFRLLHDFCGAGDALAACSTPDWSYPPPQQINGRYVFTMKYGLISTFNPTNTNSMIESFNPIETKEIKLFGFLNPRYTTGDIEYNLTAMHLQPINF